MNRGMMVKDHASINDDLNALAEQNGVTLPHSLDAKHQSITERFEPFVKR
jgi:predicted outer membrane protein